MRRSSLILALVLLLPLTLAHAETVPVGGSASGLEARVLSSDQSATVIEYELGSFARAPIVIGGSTYYSVGLPGEARTQEKGLPELPRVARSIIIPDDAEMAVAVLSSHYVDFPASPVAPSKGVLTREIDPATVAYTFDPFYQRDAWYPSELAAGGEPYIMRDVRGMVVALSPIQYNPATQTLRVYDRVVVEVRNVGPGLVNVLDRRPAAGVDAEFRKIYEQHFLNASSATTLRYAPVDEVGSMLVVCYGDFMTAMQPFVEWKKQMGIPCEMVSVAAAGGTSTAIKTYIQNYYNTHNLAYVLLVGDAAQCPPPTAAGGSSDPSYELLAGGDSYPDIFVGRFSAETTTHVGTQVTKSVEYEKLPLPGGAWYHKGTGIASALGTGIGDDGEADYQHMDVIRAKLLGFTYTLVDQIYDPTANAAAVTNALNDGRSIVNYTGHGSTAGWTSSSFSNGNVNALANYNMLPFIWSVACDNGKFSGITCFAEAWLRATNGGEPTGAVAAYMSSITQSWASPMCAQDEMVDLLVAGERRTFGGLSTNGSCQMIDEYAQDGINMFLTWIIFGDPSLRVRTATPVAMSVIHDANMDPSATTFDVTVEGVPDALCALYKSGVLYGSAFTDGGGDAIITLTATPPEDADLTVTVTAFNTLPYFGTVHVAHVSVPAIQVTPGFFDVSMEADEVFEDSLTISNVGEPLSTLHYSIDIVGVESQRSLAGSEMTVSPGSFTPGATVDFVFSIRNGSPGNEWLDGATLAFPAGVTVNSCTSFHVGNRALASDGAAGDGADVTWAGDWWNVIYPGETATATVNATVSADFPGDLVVGYTLDGDDSGASPHTLSGTITIDSPAAASVTVTAPDGGETWGIGESHDITWVSTGEFAGVAIERSIDGGASWTTIVSPTENDGLFSWLVDAPVSGDCLVRVTGASEPPVSDASDATFSTYLPITWLLADPATGDVPAGGAATVSLTFDSAGLAGDDYYAELHLDSNGGDRVVVPVTLHVRSTGVDGSIPKATVLYGNFPNPFNPVTKISFALPRDARVRILIYDTNGRVVRRLTDAVLTAGPHEIAWDGKGDDGKNVASGVYYVKLDGAGKRVVGKMALLK